MEPKKLILETHLSPGDTVMLTAAVRDLHHAHPFKYITDVNTTAQEIWENNPYITKLKWTQQIRKLRNEQLYTITPQKPDENAQIIECHYPLIDHCNKRPYHFIHGYAQYLEKKLGITIPITDFRGDIHLSEQEKNWIPQVQESPINHKGSYWVIFAGGKRDYSAKWFDPLRYQQIVNHFLGTITWVQVGQIDHWHQPLQNVINLIGKTTTRQLIRLVYHSSGILCPITFGMHLAAAVPTKPGMPKNRACVVIAGGREPSQWEAYPFHQYIHTHGMLPCCEDGGCWKSRCQKINDGDPKDKDLCVRPVVVSNNLQIPECMAMITAQDVIRRIEMYLHP